MKTALIKIACRQVIDATSADVFEKNILNASYNEFLLKSQAYNLEGKFTTFGEIKANDGRANSLHYKAGFSIDHFITALNKNIPGVKDALGKNIQFETYKFEVIESDITDISKHKVAVIYFTEILTLLDNLEDNLLLSLGDKTKELAGSEIIEDTFLLKMVADISISSYQEIVSQFSNTTYN